MKRRDFLKSVAIAPVVGLLTSGVAREVVPSPETKPFTLHIPSYSGPTSLNARIQLTIEGGKAYRGYDDNGVPLPSDIFPPPPFYHQPLGLNNVQTIFLSIAGEKALLYEYNIRNAMGNAFKYDKGYRPDMFHGVDIVLNCQLLPPFVILTIDGKFIWDGIMKC